MIFNKPEQKTIQDLQAELKALCSRLELDPNVGGFDRYQEILEELYKRGHTPDMILRKASNKENK
jgi:hypothetical protein